MNINNTIFKNLKYLDINHSDILNIFKLELIMLNIRQRNFDLLELMGSLPKYHYLFLFNSNLEYIGTFKFFELKDINILDFCKKYNDIKIYNNIFYFYISDKNNL